ncbi:hypothetical protein ABMA28_003088 [Loxostege sticticalis]|uniref:Uncharacterized protein n=2 Tax=Loxostege sticticalis TaxID=481309 RepID=A0ABD0SXC0_LOXSC
MDLHLKNVTCVLDEDGSPRYDPQEYLDTFQYAQDPLDGFTEEFMKTQAVHPCHNRSRSKVKRRRNNVGETSTKKQRTHSFVINSAPSKGLRLIKIEILELNGSQRISDTVQDNNVILSSQYVVKDIEDEIMEQTEKIINNISKKICGYSYNNYF